MAMSGKGVGVYTKMSGSGSPSYVLADPGDPEQLPRPFDVTAFYDYVDGQKRWWLKVRPGSVLTHDQSYPNITSPEGNRDLSVTSFKVTTPAPDFEYGDTHQWQVNTCNCYKDLFNPDPQVDNFLDAGTGQAFRAEDEGETLVVAYRCTPSWQLPPRLAVISLALWKSHFNYGSGRALQDLPDVPSGTNAQLNYIFRFNSEAADTSTADGHEHSYIQAKTPEMTLRFHRIGLLARPIALFDPVTGTVTQYSNGPLELTTPPEMTWTAVDVNSNSYADQDFVDHGFASYYYITGQTNAPSGYTFNYSNYST
jgi:hypothetical protein